MPDNEVDRSLSEGRPTIIGHKPRRALVVLLVAAILALIVIATLTLH